MLREAVCLVVGVGYRQERDADRRKADTASSSWLAREERHVATAVQSKRVPIASCIGGFGNPERFSGLKRIPETRVERANFLRSGEPVLRYGRCRCCL